ncbi:MAG: VWA domain-containing protein [Methylomonas sp.]|jgi:Ca-activated chloride channel family protein|uniref:vWA domain-containing protein n=1 Tax=Methylomonas sp. TaxID=418 RepID=UPI00260119AE|nr:VWA domain-containing protein [Methylomonas sp.]MCK9605492.1 VWA domain-containing protein [Methylomonas sp.]
MMAFQWPWLGLILPLPFLLRWLMPAIPQTQQAALIVPFLDDFPTNQPTSAHTQQRWPLRLAAFAWIFLVIACTRPQWLGDPLELAVNGRDLMLAVDVSGSMEEKDFLINDKRYDRLTATKYVVSDFVKRRVGDRIGLILFGTQAYLHVPLTFDRQTVETLLNEAFIGITEDDPQTSIGDAIGLAVKRLQDQKNDSRVLILLTDGANTAGELSPLKAAEIAAEHHLKIYTIGIGADEILVRSLFGTRRVNPSADLDEKTLQAIADTTGGRYFRARNTEELEQIYQILDQLEPVEKDKQFFRPRAELYIWPLAISMALAALLAVGRLRWR